MTNYIVRRMAVAIVVVALVQSLTFFGMQLIPGDPLLAFIGAADVVEVQYDPEQLAALRREYGLDKSVLQQYMDRTLDLLQGDLGRSRVTQQPVSEAITERLLVSLQLNIVTFCISTVMAVGLGTVAALYRGKVLDFLATSLAVLGVAIPGFWLAILMIVVFSVKLGWFPASGWVDIYKDPIGAAQHLVLPVLSLGVFGSATIMRQTRSSLLEVLQQDYIRTARAKGLAPRAVVLRHAFKNAMLPVATVLGFSLAGLLGGSVLIERVFAIPGVGRLALDATNSRDFPVIQGIVLLAAVAIVVANLITDLAYAYLDPRVRLK